jgi:hypothetical protein
VKSFQLKKRGRAKEVLKRRSSTSKPLSRGEMSRRRPRKLGKLQFLKNLRKKRAEARIEARIEETT